MFGWRNFVDKFKRYGFPESAEKKSLIVTIIFLAFIFTFRKWGTETFDILLGLQNIAIAIIILVVSFFVHEIAHRTIALLNGYRSQYKMWLTGLIVGVVLAFVSNGYIMFIAPGALIITHLPIHRLGKNPNDLSLKHLGWIAMSGAIANILFAVLLKALYTGTGIGLFHTAMVINIWLAIFDMLPIPPFNGSRTFFGSRYIYFLVVGCIIGIAAFLYFFSSILALFAGILFGIIVAVLFFVLVDKKW
jgi:hypothetical protein